MIDSILHDIEKFAINPNEAYSQELNQLINMHNMSVTTYIHSMELYTIIRVLLEKNIVSEDDIIERMQYFFKITGDAQVLRTNNEHIASVIESEIELMEQLQTAHDNIDESLLDNPGELESDDLVK